jgi:hypothetical protein
MKYKIHIRKKSFRIHNTDQRFYRYTERRKRKKEDRKVANISVLANERGSGEASSSFLSFCSLIRIKEEKKT